MSLKMQGRSGHSLPNSDNPNENLGFDQSFNELMEIVKKLESGELELEDSIRLFEKGIHRVRQCEKILGNAEQRVELLSQSSG